MRYVLALAGLLRQRCWLELAKQIAQGIERTEDRTEVRRELQHLMEV